MSELSMKNTQKSGVALIKQGGTAFCHEILSDS